MFAIEEWSGGESTAVEVEVEDEVEAKASVYLGRKVTRTRRMGPLRR